MIGGGGTCGEPGSRANRDAARQLGLDVEGLEASGIDFRRPWAEIEYLMMVIERAAELEEE
jgi:hypothetical protein